MGALEKISRYARPAMIAFATFGVGVGGSVVSVHDSRLHSIADSKLYFNSFIDDFSPKSYKGIAPIEKQGKNSGFGTSEGLSYARLLGQTHRDLKIVSGVDRSLETLQKTSGKILPSWKFHYDPQTREIKVATDSDATSAMDANMDIATSMIWSHNDREKTQSFLNLIWPAMNYNGEAAIPGISEAVISSPYTKILHSASYISLYEMELFNAFDGEESHEWMNVARAAMEIRKAIFIFEKYETSEKVPKDDKLEKFIAAHKYGPVAKSKIPKDRFDKVKELFIDPNSANLAFNPNISREDIEKIGIPVELKSFLRQAYNYNRYRYEDVNGTLIIKGKMTENEKNELLAIYSSPEEKKPINRLFRRSQYWHPDFVQAVFERDQKIDGERVAPHYVIVESANAGFPSTTGFNGIRTLWRIGLDCVMLKDITLKDVNLKRENIKLARKIVDALGNDPITTILETELFDNEGKKWPEPQIALASYTALAYGASQPIGENDKHYTNFYDTLLKRFNEEIKTAGFNDSIKDKYYQRATVAIALAVIDKLFESQPKASEVARVAEGKSKQLQLICDNNYGWPFTRGAELWLSFKNFPAYDDRDSLKRLMLMIRNELDWLQECDTKRGDLGQPRTESVKQQNEYRMQTASNLDGARMFNGEVWMYAQVLEKADLEKEKAVVVKAANGLNDALEAGKYFPMQKVALYSALLKEREGHPYLNLGLAKAHADIFVPSGFDEAEKIALTLVNALPTRAYKLLAEIYLRRAQYDHKLSNIAGEALNYGKALTAITTALIAEANVDPELAIGLYLLKGDIEQNYFKVAKNIDLIDSAETSFSNAYSHPQSSVDQRLKALLGLSRCVREKMDKDKLKETDKDELKRFINKKINKELEVKRPETYAASYMQLMVERIRIYSLLKDQSSVRESFSQALRFAPRGRLRVYFEQIGYFIRKGEYAKARYRAGQLSAFSDEINGAKTPNDIRQGLINESAIVRLKQIEKDIRSEYLPKIANGEMTTEQAKKKIQENMADIPDALKIQEDIKGKLAKNDKLESIADAIESTEEINVLRRELANKTDISRQARILTRAKAIAAAPFTEMLGASEKAAAACAAELSEKPYDPGFFEAMLELFNAAVWTIDAQDDHKHRSDAENLLEEILNEKYTSVTKDSSPLFSPALGVLRDKEIRGGINDLLNSREEKREEFASALGDIYSYAQMFDLSIGAYRRSLGLAPVIRIERGQDPILEEQKELMGVIQYRPEALRTVRKMAGLAHFNNEPRAHMLNGIVFGKVLGKSFESPVPEDSQMMELVVLNAGNYVPNRKPASFTDEYQMLEYLFPRLKGQTRYRETVLMLSIKYLDSFDNVKKYLVEHVDEAQKIMDAVRGRTATPRAKVKVEDIPTLAAAVELNSLDSILYSETLDYTPTRLNFREAEIYKAKGQKFEVEGYKHAAAKKEDDAKESLKKANKWYKDAIRLLNTSLTNPKITNFDYTPYARIALFEAEISEWVTDPNPKVEDRTAEFVKKSEAIKKMIEDIHNMKKSDDPNIIEKVKDIDVDSLYRRMTFFIGKAYAFAGRKYNNVAYYSTAKSTLKNLLDQSRRTALKDKKIITGDAVGFPVELETLKIEGLDPIDAKHDYGDPDKLVKWIENLRPGAPTYYQDIQ